jgi:hypothetical protein
MKLDLSKLTFVWSRLRCPVSGHDFTGCGTHVSWSWVGSPELLMVHFRVGGTQDCILGHFQPSLRDSIWRGQFSLRHFKPLRQRIPHDYEIAAIPTFARVIRTHHPTTAVAVAASFVLATTAQPMVSRMMTQILKTSMEVANAISHWGPSAGR